MPELALEKRLLPEKLAKINELISQKQASRFVTYSDAMDLMAQVMTALGFQRVDSGGFKGAAFGLSDKTGQELLIDFCIMSANNVVSVSRDYAATKKEDEVICDRLGDAIQTKFVVRIIVCLGQSEVVFLPLYKNDIEDATGIVRKLLSILHDMAVKNGKLALFFATDKQLN